MDHQDDRIERLHDHWQSGLGPDDRIRWATEHARAGRAVVVGGGVSRVTMPAISLSWLVLSADWIRRRIPDGVSVPPPARIRQAGWERRGGPSRLDRWRAAAPWRAGVLEAMAWLVPIGLGLVTLLVATDQPARTTWFDTGFVMVVAGPVLVLGLHERARLTAVALDLPPSPPDVPPDET